MIQGSVTSVPHFLVSKKLLESIRCENGEALHLSYHQARMNRAFEHFNMMPNYPLKDLITPPDKAVYRCRVIYDADTLEIEYLPYTKRHIKTLKLINADTLEYAYKYENRDPINQLFEQRGEADDILIVKNGYISDTSIANIAFYNGTQWLTPEKPLLKGTTRERLLQEKKIISTPIHVNDMDSFSGFALFNAMIGFDKIEDGVLIQ